MILWTKQTRNRWSKLLLARPLRHIDRNPISLHFSPQTPTWSFILCSTHAFKFHHTVTFIIFPSSSPTLLFNFGWCPNFVRVRTILTNNTSSRSCAIFPNLCSCFWAPLPHLCRCYSLSSGSFFLRAFPCFNLSPNIVFPVWVFTHSVPLDPFPCPYFFICMSCSLCQFFYFVGKVNRKVLLQVFICSAPLRRLLWPCHWFGCWPQCVFAGPILHRFLRIHPSTKNIKLKEDHRYPKPLFHAPGQPALAAPPAYVSMGVNVKKKQSIVVFVILRCPACHSRHIRCRCRRLKGDPWGHGASGYWVSHHATPATRIWSSHHSKHQISSTWWNNASSRKGK